MCKLEFYFSMFNIHSLIYTFFLCFLGRVSVGRCTFLVFEKNKQLKKCFCKIKLALIRAGRCDLMQGDLLIWADSAGWTSWTGLTVFDEWKMAMVMMLVEVERVKMVVVCQSAGTVVHLESPQRGLTIQK